MQNSSSLISIIIPSFNAAAYLPGLCRSLQSQTYKNFEVVIGDDGSTDQTYKVIKQFLKDKRFSYYKNKINQGLGHMTLELLNQARGSFWCYPGADDVFMPRFLEQRLKELKKRKNAVLVHGPPIFIDQNGNKITSPWPEIKPDKYTPAVRSIKQLLQHNFINQPSVLVRMDATRKILPFFIKHWKYAQDWFLWILLAATGGEFVYDPNPLHKYRIHLNSLSKKTNYSINRKIETRLVPLLAVERIKSFSRIEKTKINKYERLLQSLWIYRYFVLKLSGFKQQKKIEDIYFKKMKTKKPAAAEILKAVPNLILLSVSNLYYRRRQKISVTGLPGINDKIFKKNSL